jgi:hypothetical protein
LKSKVVASVAVAVLLGLSGCSEKETDGFGRGGRVTQKIFLPPTASWGETQGTTATWVVYIKEKDGKELPVPCDETTYHKYDVGDWYP